MNIAEKANAFVNGTSDDQPTPNSFRHHADHPGRIDHCVQFYEDDHFLVQSVAAFVGAGFDAGEGVVVIATPAHRNGIAEQLTCRGFDLAALQSSGQYVPLDAAETLAQFMVADRVDESRLGQIFEKVVGPTGRGRTGLRAFGEMVALLWAQGNARAAIRLEELWNLSCHRYEFPVFCAYPMSGFHDAANAEHFAHICSVHSRVIPAETFSGKGSDTDQLRRVAEWQQKAGALELEFIRRKRAEAESRSRETYWQAVFDNTPECVKLVSGDGTLLNMNRAGLAMLEADSIDQVLGACVFDVVAPEYRDGFCAMHERVCAGHKERFECEIIGLKSATRRRVETHAVPIIDPETGQRIHLGLTRDVSHRNNADEWLNRLVAIVESSEDAIVSKDLNGIITSWNKGAQRLFGYSAVEVIGKSVTVLMPPERVNEEPGILARIRRGERIDHYETVRRHKNGTLLDISLTVSPIKDAHGDVIGASKIARDISDKVRAKEQLEQTVAERTAQLRDTVAELEAFSYSVAHDMRAPLRSMTSYARFLEDDFAQALPPKGQEFVRRIVASAQRLDGLITDVLNYSKITRGEISLERIDVEKLTREIVDSYPDLQESGPTIFIQSPIPMVIGNIAALTQCISNLLSNAIKFVAPGTPAQVRVRAEKKSDCVRIWIEDNGIGISEEGQKRIFQMFQRLNPAGEFEGSGIGLTIVRKAVERMGGRVGVESQPGQGSRFWIELKRAA